MNKLLIAQSVFAAICQILTMFILRRIYHTYGMQSSSWLVIGASFTVLLIKWIYGAILVQGFLTSKYDATIYEGLTDLFALLLLIGFYKLMRELGAGERFSNRFRQSVTINKNIVEE